MDFNSLIGLEEKEARQVLAQNGYNNIETIINAKHVELCDSLLVCLAKEENGKVHLVCGEFNLDIKR